MPRATTSTRAKLIAAAIELFGRRGYDGASIRDIAEAAGANIAAIAYHFGGKEQLYRACLEDIAAAATSGMAERLRAIPNPSGAAPRQNVREDFKQALYAMAEFLLATPRLASFARLIVREQMDPSPAFELVYLQFMEPLHRRLCRFWSAATGDDAESDDAKLGVFALLGQILVFRLARAGAMRRMGWSDIRDQELSAIRRRIALSVDQLTGAEPAGKSR